MKRIADAVRTGRAPTPPLWTWGFGAQVESTQTGGAIEARPRAVWRVLPESELEGNSNRSFSLVSGGGT